MAATGISDLAGPLGNDGLGGRGRLQLRPHLAAEEPASSGEQDYLGGDGTAGQSPHSQVNLRSK